MSALLTHLKTLEAESIHVIREVAAEFENPVMLYSIGKDSAVMVRLAQKAFYPAKLPFPLLHVDTTWKFRDMIAFRDQFARANGFELLVHTNREPEARGVNPFDHGSQKYTTIMKTRALVQAIAQVGLRRRVRRRAPRRGEEPREGARVLVPRPRQPVGPEKPAARALEPL